MEKEAQADDERRREIRGDIQALSLRLAALGQWAGKAAETLRRYGNGPFDALCEVDEQRSLAGRTRRADFAVDRLHDSAELVIYQLDRFDARRASED